MQCYCGSKKDFSRCCELFLRGITNPSAPLELMRSRYSAYVLGNSRYIVDTAVDENRFNNDMEILAEFSQSVEWLELEILEAQNNIIEFKAYYRDGEGIKVQHERSSFILDEGRWFYKEGKLFNSKIERNRPCPCKSGKKYKKCCA